MVIRKIFAANLHFLEIPAARQKIIPNNILYYLLSSNPLIRADKANIQENNKSKRYEQYKLVKTPESSCSICISDKIIFLTIQFHILFVFIISLREKYPRGAFPVIFDAIFNNPPAQGGNSVIKLCIRVFLPISSQPL